MADTATTPETTLDEVGVVDAHDAADAEPVEDELVEDELLVEEISIDGMCGVY